MSVCRARPRPPALGSFVLLAVGVTGLQGLPAFADGLFQGLSLNGNADLYFRGDFTSGSRDAWQNSYWNTEPVRLSSGLDIEGPILGDFGLRAHIAQTGGWGYNDNRLVLGYQGPNTAVLWGDLNVSISGNEFASFQKTLQGWQVDHTIGSRAAVRTFFSREKGLVRTQTFQGANTSGPYFLSFTPVVDGSEIVKVDEMPMQFGTDYRLDYTTGQLYFEPVGKPARIIPSTSVISVSYQSATQFDTGATTYGGQIETSFLRDSLRFTGTALFLDRPGVGSSDTAAVQEDPFTGSGSTGPFDVLYRPIVDVPAGQGTVSVIVGGVTLALTDAEALQVFVDDALQQEGVDYDAFRTLGRVIFRHIVPPTSLVRIRYYYLLTRDATATSQRLYGLALRHQLNDSVSWSASTAVSQGGTSGAASGAATRIGLDFTGGRRLTASAEYRSMSPGFSYMESVGFRRNEKGLDLDLSYRPTQAVSITNRYSDVLTNSGYSFGYSGYGSNSILTAGTVQTAQTDDTTNTALDIRSMCNDTQVNVNLPGWPTLIATHQLLRNTGGTGGDSNSSTLSVGLNWSPTSLPVTFSTSYRANAQSFLGTTGSEATTATPRSSSTTSLTSSASWNPSQAFGLTGSWGHNQSASTYQDQHNQSDTLTVSARWKASERISATADVSSASSVGIVSSGFYNSSPGFSGGISGASAAGSAVSTSAITDVTGEDERYDDLSARLHLEYSPSDALRFSGDLSKRRYTSGGTTGYLADSDQRSGQLSAYWQPSQTWAVNMSLSSDLLQYLEPGRGGVLNNSLVLGLTNRAQGSPLAWNLSLVDQWGVSPNVEGTSKKATLVPTSLFDARLSAQYRLNEMLDGFGSAEFSDFASDYSNFGKISTELGVRYKLSDSLGLDLSWQFVAYDSRLAPTTGGGDTPASQDYTNHTVMLKFSSNFRSAFGGGGGMERSSVADLSTSSWGRDYATGFGGGFSGGLLPSGQGMGGSRSFSSLGRSYGGYGEFGTAALGARGGLGMGMGAGLGGLGPGWGGTPTFQGAGLTRVQQQQPPGEVGDPWRDLNGDQGRPPTDDQRDV